MESKSKNSIIKIVLFPFTFIYWMLLAIYNVLIKNMKYPLLGILYYLKQIYIVIKYAFIGLFTIIIYLNKNIFKPIYLFIKNTILKMTASLKTYIKHQKKQIELKRENSLASKKRKFQLEKERKELIESLEKSNDNKKSEKEIVYRYKAKNADGKMIKGTILGYSKLDVMSFLVNEKYTVYKIETSKFIEFLYGYSSFINSKMSKKDLVFWLTQLSTYIKSGITLSESVNILGKQMGKKGSRKKLFESISYELTIGNSFSMALEKQHGVFPPLLVNMLKAAEATGELEETLDDMANYYTEMESTRKEMISAMTYPIIISVFAILVVVFIVLYVVPQFVGIYASIGATMNSLTQAIINLSAFLQENLSLMLFNLVLIILILFIVYKKVKVFRHAVQYLLMHIPIIKNIIIYNELAIFTKTFASLLKNNVYITDSMDILSKITNNEIYREIMYNTITNISRGDKISLSFKNHWAIPEVAYYMITTGESTGELPQMLNKVSLYYQEEHKNTINTLKAFIEPFMIVFLAVIVGTIIIAVIMPMFQLYDQLS